MGQEILQQIRDEMERAYRLPEAKTVERAAAGELPCLESAALQSVLSALHSSYALVGQLPPEPPTFRGRMGARLVKLVQRMLFWYTPQIVHFQYSAVRALEEQAKILQSAERRICQLEAELGEERAKNQDLRRALEELKHAVARNSNSQADFVQRVAKAAERSEG
jgi:hypothetical protein